MNTSTDSCCARKRSDAPPPRIVLIAIVVAGTLASLSQGHAEEENAKQAWPRLKSRWSDKGFDFGVAYTSEYLYNTTGGLKTGGDYRADLSITLELDTGKVGWWENGQFFAHIQGQHGNGITEDKVGDFQVLSNIDADDFFQLSQFWYTHTFSNAWLKVGKQDSNDDFAYVEYGLEFINSSPGFSPTIPLVTYPDQDWGLALGVHWADRFETRFGVFQGDPDGGRSVGRTFGNLRGPMVLAQQGMTYALHGHEGEIRLGAWWSGANNKRIDGAGTEPDAAGFYATWDQSVYKENPQDTDDGQGVGVFAQLGFSDADVIEAESYVGIGVQATGLPQGRDHDVLGVGIFQAQLSRDLQMPHRRETAIELFYKVQVLPQWSLKPDIQFIVNPGGNGDDAFVVGLRSELTF